MKMHFVFDSIFFYIPLDPPHPTLSPQGRGKALYRFSGFSRQKAGLFIESLWIHPERIHRERINSLGFLEILPDFI